MVGTVILILKLPLGILVPLPDSVTITSLPLSKAVGPPVATVAVAFCKLLTRLTVVPSGMLLPLQSAMNAVTILVSAGIAGTGGLALESAATPGARLTWSG